MATGTTARIVITVPDDEHVLAAVDNLLDRVAAQARLAGAWRGVGLAPARIAAYATAAVAITDRTEER